ncbi:MAG: 8-amino-7-oxononanoate synthase [Pseudomonadota bacterium]
MPMNAGRGQAPMESDKFGFADQEISDRARAGRLRRTRPLSPVSATEVSENGRTLVNFCSNDYLGLSKHPEVAARAADYALRYGAGSTASRLVCGSFSPVEDLERKLAKRKGTERALVMNSGFQANLTLIPALADRDSLIVSDALNHNSLILGARLARCRVAVAPHNDPPAIRAILEKTRGQHSRTLVLTESVFSMDGDVADIPALAALAREFSAILVVDEAHATGVLGPGGMGLCPGRDVDVAMGTFGKALGGFGAYVACPARVADFLVNRCAGFIYSTALPPAVIGAADAALDVAGRMDLERAGLLEKSEFLRRELRGLGYDTGASATQIIPVIVGSEARAMDLAAHLERNGMMAVGIRPPTVPPGLSRVRLSLSAAHTWDQVRNLAAAFASWEGRGAAS